MMILTQAIINKLIDWEMAGNKLHMYGFSDEIFAWDRSTAKNLDAGREVDGVTLILKRDCLSYWAATVTEQTQLEKDFIWIFVADIGQCVADICNDKSVLKNKGVA